MSLDNSAINQLARFDTPTVANAMDRLGVRPATTGFASAELRCLFPDLQPVAGYAVACLEDTTTPLQGPGRGLEDLYRAIERSPKPVVVVCQDIGLDRLRSCHLGDVMATVMQRLGAVAFVTDGGVRDLNGIRQNARGFQVFATGAVPSEGMPNLVAVQTPVSIFGLQVEPGALLHGDINGLISVPLDAISEIALDSQRVADYSRDRSLFLQSSAFSLQGYLAWHPSEDVRSDSPRRSSDERSAAT